MIKIYGNDFEYLTVKKYLKDRNIGSANFFVGGKQVYYSSMTTVSKRLEMASEMVMLLDKGDDESKKRLEKLKRNIPVVCKHNALNITDINWENFISAEHVDLRVKLKGIKDEELIIKYSFLDNRVLGYNYSVIGRFVSEKVYSTSKEMHASLKLMMKGYLQKAIHQAIDDNLLERYAVGWNKTWNEFKEFMYAWTEEQEEFGRRTIISTDEIIGFVKKVFKSGIEVIFMFFYALAAFSCPSVNNTHGRQPVLNVYCKDKKKLHTYANLFFNISGLELGSAHILNRRDYISISNNSAERSKFFLFSSIPVILSQSAKMTASNKIIKKVIAGLGDEIKFFPVVISENKITEDNIISICLDDVNPVDDFDKDRKIFQYMCYKYVEWSEQELSVEVLKKVPRYNQIDDELAKQSFLYEYSIIKYSYMISLLKIVKYFLEKKYKLTFGEDVLRKVLVCVIENNRVKKIARNSFVADFINYFNEKVATKEKIERKDVIRSEDSKDSGQFYYVKGSFWVKEFIESHGLNISENQLKKILHEKKLLDHFINGTRTSYTVTRSFNKEKHSFYRFRTEAFDEKKNKEY